MVPSFAHWHLSTPHSSHSAPLREDSFQAISFQGPAPNSTITWLWTKKDPFHRLPTQIYVRAAPSIRAINHADEMVPSQKEQKHKCRHPHTNSSQIAQGRRVATKEQHWRKTQNLEPKRKTRETYLGHLRTPSSVSLGSGGFLSTLMPSFSTTLLLMLSVDALIDVNAKVLRFERWWLGDFSRDRFVNKPLLVAQEHAISTYLFFPFFPLINLLLLSSDALYAWTKLCWWPLVSHPICLGAMWNPMHPPVPVQVSPSSNATIWRENSPTLGWKEPWLTAIGPDGNRWAPFTARLVEL